MKIIFSKQKIITKNPINKQINNLINNKVIYINLKRKTNLYQKKAFIHMINQLPKF